MRYDLRLELDAVLKSWAVTKGPSLTVGEKRHPFPLIRDDPNGFRVAKVHASRFGAEMVERIRVDVTPSEHVTAIAYSAASNWCR